MALKTVLLALPLIALAGVVVPVRGPARWIAASLAGIAVAAGAAALVPPGILAYLASFATMAGVYAVLSLGLNVQWGYTGLFNIGIAGFFAIGAFTSALVTTVRPTGIMATYTQQAFGLDMPFVVGLAAGGAAAALIAWLVAIPVLRLREDYLAIATIGVAEIIRLVFQNERWLANGPQPLRGIPRPLYCLVDNPPCPWLPEGLHPVVAALTPRDYIFVYLAIVTAVLLVIYAALQQAVRSPWGRVLRAIREEETAAAMSGKDVASFKRQALVVGAAVMGMGGSLYAHYMVSIDYGHFEPLYGTFIVWVMLMLGGSGNNKGAILGAFVIWGVWSLTAYGADAASPLLGALSPDLPARSPYLRFLLIAVVLELILLLRPEGVLGAARAPRPPAAP